MGLSTGSLSILYLDFITSEFEKINYVYVYIYIYIYTYIHIYIYIYIIIYIMSLDQALESYKEKGIHWNYN